METTLHNSPEAVAQYYQEWTGRYIEGFGDYFQAMRSLRPGALVRNMMRFIPTHKGARILDAGCGVCGPAMTLAKLRPVQIEALTISEDQVGIAKQKIAAARRLKGSIEVRQGDFHQLSAYYPAEHFDGAYFLESLVHSHQPDKAIKSVREVLKPQGYLYIKDLFKGPDHPADPEMVNYPVRAIDEQFCLAIREVGDIINLLTRNGFRIERCGVPDFRQDFSKGNAFTAKHLFHLRQDRTGPWMDEGLIFLHWLEIVARKWY